MIDGLPPETRYLGDKLDNVTSIARELLDLLAGTAQPPVMILFRALAGALASDVYQNTTRKRISAIVIPFSSNKAIDFLAGSAHMLYGLNPADGLVWPVAFTMEPGVDYQFVGIGGPIQTAVNSTMWLLGTEDEA